MANTVGTDGREYEIGAFYLVGSELRLVRYGDPKVIDVDFSPDEAAEFVSGLSGYPGQHTPTGVRIYTSARRKQKRRKSGTGWPA